MYNKEHDILKSLIDEARWSLTDSQINQLKPIMAPRDIELAINNLYDMMGGEQLKAHPFSKWTTSNIDRPDISLLKIFKNPEYFPFMCYHLFGLGPDKPLRLLSFQHVCLMEFWWRQFPMLIATRGFGKCVTGDTLVDTENGLQPIKDLMPAKYIPMTKCPAGARTIYGESGYKPIEYIWSNGISPIKKIKTNLGFSLDATANHPVRVVSGSSIVWKEAGQIAPGDIIVMKAGGDFPDKSPATHEEMYALGLLCSSKIRTKQRRITTMMKAEDSRLIASTFNLTMKSIPLVGGKIAYISDYCINKLKEFGFSIKTLEFPSIVLSCNKELVKSFLRGLFKEHLIKIPGGLKYKGRPEFLKTLQILLLKMGIVSRLTDSLEFPGAYMEAGIPQTSLFEQNLVPGQLINEIVQNFSDKSIHRQSNNHNITRERLSREPEAQDFLGQNLIFDYVTEVYDGEAETFDVYVPDGHSFISNGVISHNSFLLGLYIMIKLTFHQGIQIAVVSKTLRQSKTVFEYCERIWNNSPVFRDMVKFPGDNNGPKNAVMQGRYEFRIGNSVALFLPLGHNGESIRGIRANVVIADEVASITEDVYAVVVQGFGAVAGDPIDKAGDKSREKIMKALGLWTNDMEPDELARRMGNQSILSGTAFYQFNHFYRYFKNYRDIIKSKGNQQVLTDLFKGNIPPGFDYRKYSIMRVPWQVVPQGYMEESIIGRAQQLSSTSNFLCEYGAVFPSDSDGFFKRSLIEKCTIGCQDISPPDFPSSGIVDFSVQMTGRQDAKYFYGIDPALQNDNFAVVIVEAWPDHRRVVYCWTTKKSDHRSKRKTGRADWSFYDYAARKLRDLFRDFPPEQVLIDSQGGGYSLEEALSKGEGLEDGELPIYRVINNEKPNDTDHLPGLKLLRMINFRDNSFMVDANWGLRKDFETRCLLFPRVTAVEFALARQDDIDSGRTEQQGDIIIEYDDTMENILLEIEEIKNELSTIVHEQTANGNERWDTPENKHMGHKRGPLRKDRYSALLLANWGARTQKEGIVAPALQREEYGLIVSRYTTGGYSGPAYIVPPAMAKKTSHIDASTYGAVVKRGV